MFGIFETLILMSFKHICLFVYTSKVQYMQKAGYVNYKLGNNSKIMCHTDLLFIDNSVTIFSLWVGIPLVSPTLPNYHSD